MKKLGIIVNPIAGMGGKVGLKGSDGDDILRKAKEMGAVPEAPRRAIETLRVISRIKDELEVVTYRKEMGEDEALECGFSPVVIGSVTSGETSARDTQKGAKEMEKLGVDLLLFAGGDGTARDVHGAVGERVPVLGIPAGVKIHSAVFAVTPRHAGQASVTFLRDGSSKTREAEVMDIDEDAFRDGVFSAKLYGYLRIPEERRFMQSMKSGGPQTEREAIRGIASDILISMVPDCLYIFGPGTTTRAIVQKMGIEKTLLGIDVVMNRQLVAKDANESDLLKLIDGKQAKIVVTIIGGQGYIFGRGNQPLSAEVIRKVGKENIILVATKAKLASLRGRPLLVDTRDEEVDEMLSGYIMVTVGLHEYLVYKVGY